MALSPSHITPSSLDASAFRLTSVNQPSDIVTDSILAPASGTPLSPDSTPPEARAMLRTAESVDAEDRASATGDTTNIRWKKPRNSFILFRMEFVKERSKNGSMVTQQELSKQAGEAWHILSKEKRAHYEARARTEKLRAQILRQEQSQQQRRTQRSKRSVAKRREDTTADPGVAHKWRPSKSKRINGTPSSASSSLPSSVPNTPTSHMSPLWPGYYIPVQPTPTASPMYSGSLFPQTLPGPIIWQVPYIPYYFNPASYGAEVVYNPELVQPVSSFSPTLASAGGHQSGYYPASTYTPPLQSTNSLQLDNITVSPTAEIHQPPTLDTAYSPEPVDDDSFAPRNPGQLGLPTLSGPDVPNELPAEAVQPLEQAIPDGSSIPDDAFPLDSTFDSVFQGLFSGPHDVSDDYNDLLQVLGFLTSD
ncbi:hypothetical protein OBBRIDRAFT_472452 [Obba rivulosa]|uniref:HMG box domain-containing protein n=1 Tax=Obba rivulosa TaxID=1052685 RepID=A0A8E2DL51_9APHY|nr:hypothetical protein OBBRIDRAFT_472452 [Obba rivulosa]